jgi:hypothetical protein
VENRSRSVFTNARAARRKTDRFGADGAELARPALQFLSTERRFPGHCDATCP